MRTIVEIQRFWVTKTISPQRSLFSLRLSKIIGGSAASSSALPDDQQHLPFNYAQQKHVPASTFSFFLRKKKRTQKNMVYILIDYNKICGKDRKKGKNPDRCIYNNRYLPFFLKGGCGYFFPIYFISILGCRLKVSSRLSVVSL